MEAMVKNDEFSVRKEVHERADEGVEEVARALLLVARELKRMNDIEVSKIVGNGNQDDVFNAYKAEGWG